jgi:Protein of unknown function (DUF1583)
MNGCFKSASWSDSPFCGQVQSRIQTVVIALVVCLIQVGSVYSQLTPQSSLLRTLRTNEVDDRNAKIGLALDAARVAAEAELFDLSFEAVKRACGEGPPIAKPQIQSSLLGGQTNNTPRVVAGRPGYQVPEVSVQYGAKLFSLVDKWKSKKAPPERVLEALEQLVFPISRPNEILLLSNAPSVSPNSSSYDFIFAKPKTTRYLSFELIELAGKNQTLPALVEKLEKMRVHPNSQSQATAMLIYAQRVSGQKDAAAKSLDDLLAHPVSIESTLPLYHALTQVIPDVGETSIIPVKTSVPLLTKLLKQNVTRMDIRAAILELVQQVIASGNQADFDACVAMVVDMINQMPGAEQNTINYMLENFYRNLVEECKRQGKAAMAVEISTRAVDVRAELGLGWQGSTIEAGEMASFAELQPDVLRRTLRKILIDRPLVKLEQLNLALRPQVSAAPDFFHLSKATEKLERFSPYPGSKAISLLDLLLNQSDNEGQAGAVVKELLANASENNDVKRFLAGWLNLRNEMQGRPVDSELAKLANFESDKEYIDWWKSLPMPAAIELFYQRTRKGTVNEELQVAFEQKFTDEQPLNVVSEARYRRRLAAEKSLVDANRLKHWIVSYEPISWQNEDIVPFWTIDEKQKAESLGGAWYSQLIFRYPLPANSSIKFTADRRDRKMDGLYCGGVTTLSFDEQQGVCYAIAPNVRVLGQFTSQSANPTRVIEGTFKDNLLNMKMGEKTIDVLDYSAKTIPFVGLASYGVRPSAFSDVVIATPAQLLREVSMLDEELTGWTASLLQHGLPKLAGRIESAESNDPASYENLEVSPMWTVVDNELRAGKSLAEVEDPKSKKDANEHQSESTLEPESDQGLVSSPRQANQSNMTYSRPLCEDEQIEYEFYHQPEIQNASPSIGRIAYLIRDGKITLKWIATNQVTRQAEAEPNYLGDDPAAEILAPVKLEANAWNRVQVRIEKGKAIISIAGADVYRRPLEKNHVSRFGFYCNPQEDQVRIRKVVLKGDWPTVLPKDLWELK